MGRSAAACGRQRGAAAASGASPVPVSLARSVPCCRSGTCKAPWLLQGSFLLPAVFGMVPFLNSILGTMLPMLGMAKQDHMKSVFCYGKLFLRILRLQWF